ncbi:2,3-bisphosphoglycerate-dependent phosphoglycerate mutase [Patescibacteria group bacterium]|nr:2,3-bisphosphoglycerate-dependent phosphoglycerate mutase [Patescibacteria group bacterium]
MALLALIRHGESEWNAKNLWTGWTDIPLSEKGKEEARTAAKKIKDTHWDYLFESDLIRAKQTSDQILTVLNSPIPRIISSALRERNYGVFTGRNKLEVEKELGEAEYLKLRRGWDRPIDQGESLKQVYGRVVPYFQKEIEPLLQQGKNIIISAHGNSLRALLKYLENISDEDIANVELQTGEAKVISFPIQSAGYTLPPAPPDPSRQV